MYQIDAAGCADLFSKFLKLVIQNSTPDNKLPNIIILKPFIATIQNPSDFIVNELCSSFNPLIWLNSVIKSAITAEKFGEIQFSEHEGLLHAYVTNSQPFHLLDVQGLCLASCMEASTRQKKIGSMKIVFRQESVYSNEMYSNMREILNLLIKNCADSKFQDTYQDFSINKSDKMKLLGNKNLDIDRNDKINLTEDQKLKKKPSPFIKDVYEPLQKAYAFYQKNQYKEAIQILNEKCLHKPLANTMAQWIKKPLQEMAAVS
jgi:hypothetical protein